MIISLLRNEIQEMSSLVTERLSLIDSDSVVCGLCL